MQIVTIDDCNGWRVDSYGNGWGYQITRKRDGATLWLQDDDATQWRRDYEAMQIAVCDPRSRHYGRNWSDALATTLDDCAFKQDARED